MIRLSEKPDELNGKKWVFYGGVNVSFLADELVGVWTFDC